MMKRAKKKRVKLPDPIHKQILVVCKEFIIDSAGAGYKRGGLGQIVKVRKLYKDNILCKAGIYPNGVMSPIKGLFGGKHSSTEW